ncbi:hypothetical protein E8E12_001155 [Didymella heteroderae]|uniref:RING-type domain-containing protein n=1 Tax=Didymella heteroderae TaxID=1769908 RepID=A0A9P4WVR8_9PLEO|nr:hypothetical protein E8E12_001155 [Didymella heteroderae]
MSIFASKAAFVELGLEVVTPSTAHMYQDCFICKDPLDVNIHSTATAKHHAAVRIGVCGHVHGQECLSLWLDVGNSCPTCKHLLFEDSGRRVSQSDAEHVVYFVKRMFGVVGEKRAMAAIVRLVGKQEAEQARQQRIRGEAVKNAKAKELQAPQDDFVDDDDDDWMDDSDAEKDFEMDEEDGGGIVLEEEDTEPQSAAI